MLEKFRKKVTNTNFQEICFETAYYHIMARVNLNKSKKSLDFYYQSIKVHTQEAQNLHQLKSPLSDPNFLSKCTSKCENCKTRFT